MAQSREVNVNWLRINVPSVVSIIIVGITVASYVQKNVSKVETLENNGKTRAEAVDRSFEEIKKKLDNMNDIPYRVDSLERNLATTNSRMDQYLQSLSSKIDGVNDKLSSMSTKVEVLSNKIDILVPDKKAEFVPSFRR